MKKKPNKPRRKASPDKLAAKPVPLVAETPINPVNQVAAVTPWRFEFGAPVLVTIFFFLLYRLTLPQFLPGGDTPELLLVVQGGGIAHPPGYPLYTILAKSFAWILSGHDMATVHLFSAFVGALSCGILTLIIGVASGQWFLGVIVASLSGSSFLIWDYSRLAEVFALNNLIVGIGIFCLLAWQRLHKTVFIYGLVFVTSLSVSHHHTGLIILGPLLVWVFWNLIKAKNLAQLHWPLVMGAIVAGLTPLLYLVWQGQNQAMHSWANIQTGADFFRHLSRSEYGTFRLAGSALQKDPQFLNFLVGYTWHILTINLGFIFLAAAWIWRERKTKNEDVQDTFMPLLAALVLYLFIFAALGNLHLNQEPEGSVLKRFWILPDYMSWIVIGLVAGSFLQKQNFRVWRLPVMALMSVAAGLMIWKNWQYFRSTENPAIELYSKEFLRPLSPNSILLVRGELDYYTLLCLQKFSGLRPDVLVMDRALMTKPWYKKKIETNYPGVIVPGPFYRTQRFGGYDIADFFNANNSRDIFMQDFSNMGVFESRDSSWQAEYFLQPFGMIKKVTRKADWNIGKVKESFQSLPNVEDFWQKTGTLQTGWEYAAAQAFWEGVHQHAYTWLNRSVNEVDPNKKLIYLDTAEAVLKSLVNKKVLDQAVYYKNLGMVYEQKYRMLPSQKDLLANLKQAWSQFVILKPNDQDSARIRETLSRL